MPVRAISQLDASILTYTYTSVCTPRFRKKIGVCGHSICTNTHGIYSQISLMCMPVSLHQCIPGNPACLLLIWLVVLSMDLCYHSGYICPVVYSYWYSLCIRLASSTDWNKAVRTSKYFENPLDLKHLDLQSSIY